MPLVEGETDPDATVDQGTDADGNAKGTGDAVLNGKGVKRLKEKLQLQQKNDLKRQADAQAVALGAKPTASHQYGALPPLRDASTGIQQGSEIVYEVLPADPDDIEMQRRDSGQDLDNDDADDVVPPATTASPGGVPATLPLPSGPNAMMPQGQAVINYEALPTDEQMQAQAAEDARLAQEVQDNITRQNAKAAKQAKQRRAAKIAIFTTLGVLLVAGIAAGVAAAATNGFASKKSGKPTAKNITGLASNTWDITPVTTEVASKATPADGGPVIDLKSVLLVDADSGSTSTKTVAGIGAWTLDAANGKITFTADKAFTGKDVSVFYTIADTGGTRSDKASLQLPLLKKGTGGPDIKMTTLTPVAPPKPVTFNVPALTTKIPNGAAIDITSVALSTPDEGTKLKQTILTQGAFTLDPATGIITFTPIIAFTGGMVSTRVTIKSTDGLISNASLLTAQYFNRPKVYDQLVQDDTLGAGPLSVNVITGASPEMAAVKGSYDIDPKSVVLLGIIPFQPLDIPLKTTVTADGKTLTVEGQGVWTATDPTGIVTFTPAIIPAFGTTPATTFKETPHPVTYQIADTQALASNVGRVIFDANLTLVRKQFLALRTATDAVFWTNYESTFITGSYDVLDTDLVGKLTLYRDLNAVVIAIMSKDITVNDKNILIEAVRRTYAVVPAGAPVGTISTIENDFMMWTAAGRTLQSLFNLSKKVTAINDADGNALTTTNAVRLARLRYLSLMLSRWWMEITI